MSPLTVFEARNPVVETATPVKRAPNARRRWAEESTGKLSQKGDGRAEGDAQGRKAGPIGRLSTIKCLNRYYSDVARPLYVELKQTRPFDLLEEEAHLSIARTAALLEHAMIQVLKPYGLTPTQYNVLRILRGAGPAGLCRNEIGARLLRPVPDVTRLLDRMTELKLIGRAREDADRRLVRTHITPKGMNLLAELDEPVRAFHQERLSRISQQKLRQLADTLAELRDTGD